MPVNVLKFRLIFSPLAGHMWPQRLLTNLCLLRSHGLFQYEGTCIIIGVSFTRDTEGESLSPN